MNEKRKMIIFDQYTGKGTTWRNPEGVLLQVVYYLNLEDMKLNKLFIEKDNFLIWGVKGMVTKRSDAIIVLEGTFSMDEEEHEHVDSLVEIVKFGKLVLDKAE